MTTKIGLIGDIHACAEPLQEALSIFRKENVALVLCTGDIAGYGTELEKTVELLIQSKCTAILGNHDAWFLDSLPEQSGNPVGKYFSRLPCMWESVIEGIHPRNKQRGLVVADRVRTCKDADCLPVKSFGIGKE